jgi:hypothetical protein
MPLSAARRAALKAFGLQILNTTIAVLIALAFEGLVQWRRDRALVATAEEHLDGELRDNRDDARRMQGMIVSALESADARLRLVDAAIAVRKAGQGGAISEPRGALLTFSAVFGNSSHATADATGALGHMRYAEARRYAGVYEYQQHVDVTLARLSDQFLMVASQLQVGLGGMELGDLNAARSGLLTLSQTLRTLEGQRQTLLLFYDRALERR